MSARQLQDRFEQAAQVLPAPDTASLDDIRGRARGRRRRRQMWTAAGSVSLVLLVVLAGTELLPTRPGGPVIEPVAQDGDGGVELADDAVWRSPSVPDATAAVRVFADRFLGWEDPDIELGTDDETGPVWVRITEPVDASRQVEALFTPTPVAGVWQVVQVGDGLGSGPGPMVISLDNAPPDAAGAELFVRYAGQTWNLTLDEEQLRDGRVDLATHGLPPGGQRDSALIVYHDAGGETLTAAGGHSGTGDEPTMPSAEPQRITERETVLELDVDGSTRRMIVWGAANGTICIELSGTGCIAPLETGQMMGARLSSHSAGQGQPTIECEYGAVHPDVAEVQLQFPDGTEAEAQVAAASDEVGGRYYAHCWTGEQPSPTIVLLDAEGRELHRHSPNH